MADEDQKRQTRAIVTEHTIVISAPDLEKQIRECIERTGKATFTISEVSISEVPGMSTVHVVPSD
jgi:hypothetical protein